MIIHPDIFVLQFIVIILILYSIVKKLALKSDVILENFKPGTLEKFVYNDYYVFVMTLQITFLVSAI